MKKLILAVFVLSMYSAVYASSTPISSKMPAAVTNTAKGTGVRFITSEGEPVKFLRATISIDAGTQGSTYAMVTTMASDGGGFIPLKVTAGAKYRISIKPGEYYLDRLKIETGTVIMPLEQGQNEIVLKKALKKELTIRVRDFDTKEPIMNAKITETRSFGTEYSKQGRVDRGIGLTGKEGDFYTDEFNPDHVSRFGATADGYHEEWLDIDSFQPGGSYEFELKRKSDF